MTTRFRFCWILLIAALGAVAPAQAVTLDFDPVPGPDYAIADIELNLTDGGSTTNEPGDRTDLTDGDLTTGINFGRFLNPGLLDVGVTLTTPTTTDLFRLTGFEVVFNNEAAVLDPSTPQLLFTDADGVPQALSTTITFQPFGFFTLTHVEADFGSSDFLLLPGTTLLLSGIDLPLVELEIEVTEVIVEGSVEPIPEPTSLALLGLGSIALLRRRSRHTRRIMSGD